MYPILSPQQIQKITEILANNYTGNQLEHFLAQCGMSYPDPGLSKAKRLYNSFVESYRATQSVDAVYKFVMYCLDPVQGLDDSHNYNEMRMKINQVLMLVGLEVCDNGRLRNIVAAQSLSEVQRRTRDLRNKLTVFGAHHMVLRCCKEEWLDQDYFHAVQEAAKSLAERVREMSGLTLDGSALFETAFKISDPYIALNKLVTSTEKNQQNGLREMLCGVFHMVRNVTAHEMRIRWDIKENEAVDMLTQISYLHKMLDQCISVPGKKI